MLDKFCMYWIKCNSCSFNEISSGFWVLRPLSLRLSWVWDPRKPLTRHHALELGGHRKFLFMLIWNSFYTILDKK